MPTILRTRLNAFFSVAPRRHHVWQLLFTGCALFWTIAVIGVMSLS